MINIADLLLENNTASERPNNDNPIVDYSDNHEKIDNDTKVEDNEPLDETVETRITKPFIGKEITLYTGSSKKLNIIDPVNSRINNPDKYTKGINLGTRFSAPRYSSYWCDNDMHPKFFAFHRELLQKVGDAYNITWLEVYNEHIRGAYNKEKFYMKKSEKSDILPILKSIKIYIHKVTVPTKIVGRGHHKIHDEYTLDIAVKPDDIYEADWNDEYIQSCYEFIDDNKFEKLEDVTRLKHSSRPKRGWNPLYDLVYHNDEELKSIKKLVKSKINESSNNSELYPVYIVTSYTDTKFGKIIRKASDCYYTHAAISFESDLHEMYSFGNSGALSNSRLGGMTCESLNDYIKTSKNAVILVSVVFVKEKDYKKLLAFFDEYLNNSRNTRYNYSNLFNVLKNKPIPNMPSLSYICSQFVDSLFKFISIDMTDKPSNLVTPEDIANLHNVKPTVYKLFEGKAIDYNVNRIEKILDKMYSKAKPIKEVTLLEAKEFPIQFNDEGDLLISKKEKIDFLAEYNKSKKLRQSYVKYKNLEGLKYECCKMWYINTILMKLLDDKNLSHSDREDYNNYRSKILTEFSQYLKEIQKIDKSFNFGSFYETTPFSNTKIKINGSTIKYTTKLMKFIFK